MDTENSDLFSEDELDEIEQKREAGAESLSAGAEQEGHDVFIELSLEVAELVESKSKEIAKAIISYGDKRD